MPWPLHELSASLAGTTARRAISMMVSLPNKFLGSLLNTVLFMLATVLQLSIFIGILASFSLLIISLLIVSPLVLPNHYFRTRGVLYGTINSIITFASTLNLVVLGASIILAWIFFSATVDLITSIITGARFGWRSGFVGVVSSIFNGFGGMGLSIIVINPLFIFKAARTITAAQNTIAPRTQHVLMKLLSPFRGDEIDLPTEEQFDRLALTENEVTAIGDDQQVLLDDEMTLLQSSVEPETTHLLTAYCNLKQRLDNDECPILFDRPERADSIIMVKQYFRDNQWLPVPTQSTLFDKNMLKNSFLSDPRHPMTRDSFISPKKHTVEDTAYETRYRFHNLYIDGLTPGISQELNVMGAQLKALLQTMPRIELSENKLDAPAVPTHQNSTPTAETDNENSRAHLRGKMLAARIKFFDKKPEEFNDADLHMNTNTNVSSP